MTEHQHQCRACHPEAFPPVPPAGSRYLGFDNSMGVLPAWAQGPALLDGYPRWDDDVVLNGEPWRDRDGCTEALAGVVGWAVVACPPLHDCECGQGWQWCSEVRWGHVELVRHALGATPGLEPR